MQIAEIGKTVMVHYTGSFDAEGVEVFDSSVMRGEPIEFEVGAGMMIPGFDRGVIGMAVGEKKKIFIPAEDAYGQASEENYIKFDREQVPADMNPKAGDELALHGPQGETIPVKVIEVTEEYIVLDANHPMAGKDLYFEVELVGVK